MGVRLAHTSLRDNRLFWTSGFVIILSLYGCGEPHAQQEEAPPEAPPVWGYTETGDLPELREHGLLRVAAQRRPDESYLPRTAVTRPRLRELAEELAADLDLDLLVV